ncbi:hypothetical protein BDY21DRAFT_362875 [Lineolata rhizophorae]|uniref:OTU domain-containing protein n=1 Tax=Lineolata rhizophorae TaxID=578093 RepID=A0A6A6P3Q0_9PEZI|nr:hypothetical protein BDY21DRAFT_362875 [Lineolata rhizophorae]
MDELLARHRKEQRDLQSRITQKKKAATKKTRKGVNDECATLERELKERQKREVATLKGDNDENDESDLIVEDEPLQDSVDAITKPVEQLSLSSVLEQQESNKQRKPNRAKARLARRAAEQEAMVAAAAEEAASMPDYRELERKEMLAEFEKRGLREKVIRADGHCLYSAVADQIDQLGLSLKPNIKPTIISEGEELPGYKVVRQVAADFISNNSGDFVPFLEEPLEEHVRKVRDTGEWGGQPELLALARTYHVRINVLQGDSRVETIVPDTTDNTKEIWLAYYRHNFGLGEHYNSLRRAT